MAGEEHGPFTLYDAVLWFLGAAVAVIGALTRWVFLDTRKKIDALEEKLDKHLIEANGGLQRLTTVETLIRTLIEERRESARIMREDVGTIHRRLDEIIGPRHGGQ